MSLSMSCDGKAVGGHIVPSPTPPQRGAVWGFWSTVGWIALATGAGNAAAAACRGLHGAGLPVGELAAILAPFTAIAVLAFAAHRAHWPIGEYLGLFRPRLADLAIGIAALYALALAVEIAARLSGLNFPPSGAPQLVPIMPALYTVMFAPVLEEVLFRGFLYRGWEQTRLGSVGTIVLSSMLFSAVHLRYGHWLIFASIF